MTQDNLIEVRDLAVEFVTGEHHPLGGRAQASTACA